MGCRGGLRIAGLEIIRQEFWLGSSRPPEVSGHKAQGKMTVESGRMLEWEEWCPDLPSPNQSLWFYPVGVQNLPRCR